MLYMFSRIEIRKSDAHFKFALHVFIHLSMRYKRLSTETIDLTLICNNCNMDYYKQQNTVHGLNVSHCRGRNI